MLEIISVILGVIGSVSLLLYSVFSFRSIIREAAGEKVKVLMYSLTSNPFKGILVGTAVTGIVQSGTAMSVLAASLADAGLISFYNTLGVIYGINIGAAITAQLIAFNVMAISPFIIFFGLILWRWGGYFSRYAKSIIYIGLVFLSIHLISYFVSLLDQGLITSLIAFTTNPFLAILAGTLATILLQSSGVVSGIILVLAGSGNVDLPQAVGLILGANIGTTATVMLASFAMGKEGRKVAWSHFLFSFLGVIFVLPLLDYLYTFIRYLNDGIVHEIANAHLVFNIFCTVIFLILIKPFARFITWIVDKITKAQVSVIETAPQPKIATTKESETKESDL